MPNVRFRVGSVEVLVANDGLLMIEPQKLVATHPREEWEGKVGPVDPDGCVPTPLNCFVIHSGGKRVLVDTGVSAKRDGYLRGVDSGQLVANLAQYGLTPDDIDLVVNTHAHFDHIGGNARFDGETRLVATFPKATYYLGEADWNYYTDPARDILPAVQDNLLTLGKDINLKLVDGAHALTPDVRLVPAPGHSPGHLVVEITNGGEGALIMGDSLHNSCHALHPTWGVAFDLDTEQALATRRALLEQVAAENRAMLVCHFPQPGIGTLRPEGEGWRWTRWEP